MTYVPLILFFSSLIGIIVMIGKKMILLKNSEIAVPEKIAFEIPHLEKIRHFTIQNTKKYGHKSLVLIMRYYFRSANFIKYKYEEIKIKLENKINKNRLNGDKKEISKFLKIIGDYKQKIREIKHRIKNEENL